MTIITTQSRVSYAGDNVSTSFPVPFEFFLTSDLTAIKTEPTGIAATLTLGIDYTLANADVPGGGTLSTTLALMGGETLAIFLNPPIAQESHYISNSPFPSETLENDIDRQTQISQRLQDQISRSVRQPDGDIVPLSTLPSAALRAGMGLAFNSTGQLSLVPSQAFQPSLLVNVTQFGVTLNGSTDDTAAYQLALTSAAAGGYNLFHPAGVARTTAPLTINSATAIYGSGCSPYLGQPLGNQRAGGSWFHFNHTGKGIICQQATAGQPISGLKISQLGTFRDQPAPGVGWAPTANDYDVWCDNAALYIDDVMLLNATKGVYFKDETLDGYAQIDINRLRGQVFNDMIHIDACFDVCKISNVHRWVFWSDDINTHTYEVQNANILYLARCDSPMISNVFGIFMNAGVRFAQNSFGTTTYAQFNNCDFDNALQGVYVDSSVANGVLAQFENLICLAPTLSVAGYNTGSVNVNVAGSNSQLDFGKCEFRQAQGSSVLVNGSGNRLAFGGAFQAVFYNQNAGSNPAIQNNGANNVIFGMRPFISVGALNTVGTLTGTGSNGTYTGIALGGSATGSGAIATVTVAAGAVSAVAITTAGDAYLSTDTLTFTIPGGSGTCKPASMTSIATKYVGTGNTLVDDWRPWTPTVTPGTGAITTVGPLNCWYKSHGNTVSVQYDIQITTNGSGASTVNFSLPPVPLEANVEAAGSGRELNIAGKALQAFVVPAATLASIANYDNTYPASNGCRLVGNLQWQFSGLPF